MAGSNELKIAIQNVIIEMMDKVMNNALKKKP